MSNSCEQCTTTTDPVINENIPKSFFNGPYALPVLTTILLLLGITFQSLKFDFFSTLVALLWFGITYFVIATPILIRSAKLIGKGNIYNEFVLMSVATLGAFFIGSYAEGIAVMLFYVVGETFQDSAVDKAKKSIEALLKIQDEEATILKEGVHVSLHPKNIEIGEILLVKQGQKIPLDGHLKSKECELNTAALTGESLPEYKQRGDLVYAGSINLGNPIEIRVTSRFEDTKLSQILRLVQEATGRKAKTQLLISKLAKVYTPLVFWLAIALVVLPFLLMGPDYIFQTWFQRALIFLVISCPCALVISIPLGYFGGIGAGSRNGILFKGSNFLEVITKVDTVVMDKTGTLTKGIFEVQEVFTNGINKHLMLELVGVLEVNSTHPIAKAIVAHAQIQKTNHIVTQVKEMPGQGIYGKIGKYAVLAGNSKLLDAYAVSYPADLENKGKTLVLTAIDGTYAGYIAVADALKDDAKEAINTLKKLNIEELIILSGDKQGAVASIAEKLGIQKAYGNLMPEEKLVAVEKLKEQGRTIAFVGDGINDAPVLAIADVGMAMGAMGSDVAIETADVIIQTDQPSKVATAISIGIATKSIIWQNISLAMGVKILVLILGAFGMATMWQAVIADVGVALLAILNAVRIQRITF